MFRSKSPSERPKSPSERPKSPSERPKSPSERSKSPDSAHEGSSGDESPNESQPQALSSQMSLSSVNHPIRQSFAAKWIGSVIGNHKKILMMGVEKSGKTTLLYRMVLEQTIKSIPTVGYNCETIKYHHHKLTFFDVGGHPKIRNLWHSPIFHDCACVVYVLSCASIDEKRWDENKREINSMLRSEVLHSHVPVLYVVTKCDLQKRVPFETIHDRLSSIMESSMQSTGRRTWGLIETSSLLGENIEGVQQWIVDNA